MNHPTYWTYEYMFQDVDCWHESIKNKFNQQQSTVVKEEDELSSSGRFESKPNDISIQLKHLDVSVCLVDCRYDIPTTSTQFEDIATKLTTKTPTESGVLNTSHPSASSIVVNENRAATNTFISTSKKCHICEHCEKEFGKKSDLIRHVRTHTGERPYSCNQCEYTCSLKHHLTTHQLTHTGHKPFSCTVCGKSFAQSGHLKQHHLTHTSVKQHKCDQCGKMFARKWCLTQHLFTHTADKRHKCEQCGKMFGQKSHLTKHLRRHTGDKP